MVRIGLIGHCGNMPLKDIRSTVVSLIPPGQLSLAIPSRTISIGDGYRHR